MYRINDSNETDGRFLLHALAKQVLGSPVNGSVLWLACGPITDRQVATALKKNGCEVATLYLRGGMQSPEAASLPLAIRSLTTEIACAFTKNTNTIESWNPERFLQGCYKQVKTWLKEQTRQPCWVLLDDVSSLATMLGDPRVVYRFVDSLNALPNKQNVKSFGLAIRCSNDFDQGVYKEKKLEDQNVNSAPLWVGFGGQCNNLQRDAVPTTPWERHLVELADGIVDVVPLSSGYSREAHGRLVFTLHPSGRGWRNVEADDTPKSSDSLAGFATNSTVNYCITDNGVRAIRLRARTSRQ